MKVEDWSNPSTTQEMCDPTEAKTEAWSRSFSGVFRGNIVLQTP